MRWNLVDAVTGRGGVPPVNPKERKSATPLFGGAHFGESRIRDAARLTTSSRGARARALQTLSRTRGRDENRRAFVRTPVDWGRNDLGRTSPFGVGRDIGLGRDAGTGGHLGGRARFAPLSLLGGWCRLRSVTWCVGTSGCWVRKD